MLIAKFTVLLLSAGFMLSCSDQHQGTATSSQAIIDTTATKLLIASEIADTKVSATQEESTCYEGIARAKADTKEGIIGYYFWGIAVPVYADTLEKKYGMLIRQEGCIVYDGKVESWTCYNQVMDSAILAKYHVDLIEQEDQKSRQWIRALLSKQKRGAD
ncbi:hypothetical protein [Hymenobacter roseosalivarius]|nr:hypothetical protein [Hymenobacter roseosalivarius]